MAKGADLGGSRAAVSGAGCILLSLSRSTVRRPADLHSKRVDTPQHAVAAQYEGAWSEVCTTHLWRAHGTRLPELRTTTNCRPPVLSAPGSGAAGARTRRRRPSLLSSSVGRRSRVALRRRSWTQSRQNRSRRPGAVLRTTTTPAGLLSGSPARPLRHTAVTPAGAAAAQALAQEDGRLVAAHQGVTAQWSSVHQPDTVFPAGRRSTEPDCCGWQRRSGCGCGGIGEPGHAAALALTTLAVRSGACRMVVARTGLGLGGPEG